MGVYLVRFPDPLVIELENLTRVYPNKQNKSSGQNFKLVSENSQILLFAPILCHNCLISFQFPLLYLVV